MNAYQRISCEDAKQRFFDQSTDVIIVDIRDEGAFAAAHIIDAMTLSNANLSAFINDADGDIPLLVYCYHGNSSQQAGQYLAGQGFREVYSLDGGFEEWRQRYPDTITAGM